MDLALFKFFLVTARHLHFGTAAEELGIAQPALSQRIMLLEKKIGVLLFDRTRRAVRLTPAGLVFQEEARRILAETEKSIRMAKAAENGLIAEINIGYGGSVVFEPHVCNLLKLFQENCPSAKVLMHESKILDQLSGLENGELDAAIIWGPLSPTYQNLVSTTLSRTDFSVVFQREHPLALQEKISISDICKESFISLMDPPGTGIGNHIDRMLNENDILPNVVVRVSSLISVFGLAGAGIGLGIVPTISLGTSSSSFIQRPLLGSAKTNEVLLVTSRSKKSILVDSIITIAKKISLSENDENNKL